MIPIMLLLKQLTGSVPLNDRTDNAESELED